MSDERTSSWYVKYRPFTMKDYASTHINNIVKRRFTSEENRPNVVMIYGTHGCGKTTLARILSKYYLCENPNEDGTPCEQCEMCRQINENLMYAEGGVETLGVREINATKVNGKDDIEAVMEEAMIEPMLGKKKVIIFDECHKLSEAAQGVLLKPIEDIPKHLVIMFATTDIDKVKDTIQSRCQVKIEVHRQSVKTMTDRLLEISKMENLTVSRQALEIIARHNNRIPRESINMLEDVAKSFDGEVTVDNVNELCQAVGTKFYMEFYNCANRGLEDILLFNKELDENDITIKKFFSGLMQFTMQAIYIKHGISLEEYTPDFIKSVKKLFEMYKSNEFDMLLQVLEYASKMLTEDDGRNSVILTTTAMRIGKIGLLASGLTFEMGQAIIENNLSLDEHTAKIKKKAEDISNQMFTGGEDDVDENEVEKTYSDPVKIGEIAGILEELANSKDEETLEEDKDSAENHDSDIDSFFDD